MKKMNVLIIGSGAREHAMAWAAEKSLRVDKVFVAPGNGGTALMGGKVQNVDIKATAIDELLEFAQENNVDLTVVGPEQPLELGIVNTFRANGRKIIGPTCNAAHLETSKIYAKDFMKRVGIPTANFEFFRTVECAREYLSASGFKFPIVIKANGICGGKGVFIAFDEKEASQAIKSLFDDDIFGKAGREVVIEEFLDGQEASVFALTDGKNYKLFAPAQDHKRIGNGDTGKNTGGMGAYAPAPIVTPEVMQKVKERIIEPTLKGMRDEGTPYTGFLYVGLMIDADGNPFVVEYNARMGDPETQVVLPLLKSDFVAALMASVEGSLADAPWEMHEGLSATTVVIASGGYPEHYETGKQITIAEDLATLEDCLLFHAGTIQAGRQQVVVANKETAFCVDAFVISYGKRQLITSGGRVFSVTAFGGTLKKSINSAYRAVEKIGFEGAYYRTDIGAKAL